MTGFVHTQTGHVSVCCCVGHVKKQWTSMQQQQQQAAVNVCLRQQENCRPNKLLWPSSVYSFHAQMLPDHFMQEFSGMYDICRRFYSDSDLFCDQKPPESQWTFWRWYFARSSKLERWHLLISCCEFLHVDVGGFFFNSCEIIIKSHAFNVVVANNHRYFKCFWISLFVEFVVSAAWFSHWLRMKYDDLQM